ncbi:predicted protein [Nematostella vectensis]|uniref:Uncharacterized protein n=1 Tax=Nematostella vectensis TaxID=45351 RepID=A7SYL8_NEMVE|nr:predicted protein [Nematostella vectensis]|eukprot:XP_001623295.1 predicted protein [Nematostella vectensis]
MRLAVHRTLTRHHRKLNLTGVMAKATRASTLQESAKRHRRRTRSVARTTAKRGRKVQSDATERTVLATPRRTRKSRKSTQPDPNEGNPNENVPDPGEDAFFDALAADIEDEEAVCEAVNDPIAKIAKKLWGSSIAADRLKPLLAKHAKPQNCHEITVPRVNPEIWAKMPGFKRKADIKVANVQQTLQKATFSILQCCDSLLKQTKKADTTDNLPKAIDAIRLVGHATAELSHVRREQIKPVLNKEFA